MVVFYVGPAKMQGRLHGHSCALAMEKSRSHQHNLNFSKRLVGNGTLNP